jgi:hypothetical protein
MVKNMSPEQMQQLRSMQAQFSDTAPAAEPSSATAAAGATAAAPPDPSKLLSSMDPAQIKAMVNMMKSNPALIKQMAAMNPAMSGMSEEQVIKQLDMMADMDPETLKRMMSFAGGVQKAVQPLRQAWNKGNQLTGGNLKSIVAFVLVVLFGLLVKYMFFSSAAAPAAPGVLQSAVPLTSPESSLDQLDDEF